MTAIVYDYRLNLIAAHRWSKMDTSEEVISRWNGLPITASCLGAGVVEMPSDVDPFDAAYFAPESDGA